MIAGPSTAAEVLPGPVVAEVVEVIDGDTLRVRAHIWLGQTVEVSVRIAGVDAPELRGRCAEERQAAAAARSLLAALTADGTVLLRDVTHDKYGGRVVALVADRTGRDLGQAVVEAGLARFYGGGSRRSWCDGSVRSQGS